MSENMLPVALAEPKLCSKHELNILPNHSWLVNIFMSPMLISRSNTAFFILLSDSTFCEVIITSDLKKTLQNKPCCRAAELHGPPIVRPSSGINELVGAKKN